MSSGPSPVSRALTRAQAGYVKLAIALLLPMLLAVAVAGCGEQAATTVPVVHVTATVDPAKRVPDPPEALEAVAPGATAQFLLSYKGADRDTAIARYAFAVAHRDQLAQIPCYCGCVLYQHGHTSLEDCFIHSVGSDGQVTLTDHSVSCDICTGEIDVLMKMYGSTALRSIRDQIGTKYSYTGVWTDTPPIQQ